MSIFYIASNGTHTTVICEDFVNPSAEDDEADLTCEEIALNVAKARFVAAGLDVKELQISHVLDSVENDNHGWGDGPEDIGLSQGVFLEAANQLLDIDDLAIDSNSGISGFNVMSWWFVDPEEALSRLSSIGPVKNERDQKSMCDELDSMREAIGAVGAAFAAFTKSMPDLENEQFKALASAVKQLRNTVE